MRPITPDKHRSHRERRFRDEVMTAVRKKIWSEQIPCSAIIVSGRPMLTAVRARILRGEIYDISLSRALLIADAIGLDLSDNIVAQPTSAPLKPTLAEVLEAARKVKAARSGQSKCSRREPMAGMPTLFDLIA